MHANETGIKVLDEEKSGKKVHHGYFWLHHTTVKWLVFFDYQKSRDRTAPQSMLATYKGYMLTGGNEVYHVFDGELITLEKAYIQKMAEPTGTQIATTAAAGFQHH